MRNKYLLFLSLIIFTVFAFSSYSQVQRNVVLEYCTGQWCGYCPCGHQIINSNILPSYPSTTILSYHGGTTSYDSMKGFNGSEIRSLLSFSSYPTGIVDRTSGPISRSIWLSTIASQYSVPSPVNIVMTSKTYNSTSRQLNVSVTSTALQTITGSYSINFILTEDSLVHLQSFYSSCGGSGYQDYVHEHVVRNMINGAAGEVLVTDSWNTGIAIVKTLSYTIPDSINADRSHLVVLVYNSTNGVALGTIQQSYSIGVTDNITGIENGNNIPYESSLLQNYPNPFNPETMISYNIAKDEFVTLKVYNLLGEEVYTLVNEFQKAGKHTFNFVAGDNLASGIYFYKLTAGDYSYTKKMSLVK